MGQFFFCNGRDAIKTEWQILVFKREIGNVLKQLEIGEPKEKWFTVRKNHYIITTSKPYEANKICNHKSHTTISIDEVTQIQIKEGCELWLRDNIFQPDIQEESTITFKHIWNYYLQVSMRQYTLKNQRNNIITTQQLRHLPDPNQIVHPYVYMYIVIFLKKRF